MVVLSTQGLPKQTQALMEHAQGLTEEAHAETKRVTAAEELFEQRKRGLQSAGPHPNTLGGRILGVEVAAVVERALLRVRQYFVGLCNLFEHELRLLSVPRVLIWVPTERGSAVTSSDFVVAGVCVHSEHLVVVIPPTRHCKQPAGCAASSTQPPRSHLRPDLPAA